jgi:hypothetical protein
MREETKQKKRTVKKRNKSDQSTVMQKGTPLYRVGAGTFVA